MEAYNREVAILHKSMRNATMEIFGPDYDDEYHPENIDPTYPEEPIDEFDFQRSSVPYWESEEGRSATYPTNQVDNYMYYS